jgi:uncharacterized protein (TIGR02147 family)
MSASSISIFSYRSYKAYLRAWIAAQPKAGRGIRSAMAAAAQVQLAYLSQVLNGGAHLNLEQVDRLSRYMGHSKTEAHFFILIVEFERAGTDSLKKYFEDQVQATADAQLNLKHRLGVPSVLTLEHQSIYYSSWIYAAVHVVVTIARFREPQRIAKLLQVSKARVEEVLRYLVSIGLIEINKGEYVATTGRIHLGKDSPLLAKHHTNWRMQAIAAMDRLNEQNLHYSSVVTLSKEDAFRIKARLIAEIEEIKKVIKDSPAEEMYGFNVDLFGLV